ncbi:MAG TPA: ATP-binding protein, partial [candidate division Zixibacteria bacterium]|nr:ATP-binding protein [candidate division Zixibacteria bacterium]
DAFFTEFLRALTFYLTAFVAGYFSERLRNRDLQLADTSRALSRARLQTDEIIKRLTTGLLTVDRSGRIVLFNDAAESILALSGSEIRGRDFLDVFTGRLAELGRELQLTFETGVSRARREICIRNGQGSEIPLGVSVAVTATEDDPRAGVIAVFQDISDVKVMEEKARRSDRLMAVAELSASIAHEIRNPLAAIAGSAQVLQAELSLTADERRLFDLILKESSRLNRMLSDFLSYARAGRTALNRVELCHLVIEALEMMRRHPSHRDDVIVTFDSAEPVVYALGEDDPIKQIIFNLLLNAYEALGSGVGEKVISLRLETHPGSGPRLVICDNGPGIPRGAAQKIFTPFYSTKSNGSGLGLAIAHRLAESMRIGIDLSGAPGVGTSFTLTFTDFADASVETTALRVSAGTSQAAD